MQHISGDTYHKFLSAVNRLEGLDIGIGQIFCNVMKLELSRQMSDIELRLWRLDGEEAMEYIWDHFYIE